MLVHTLKTAMLNLIQLTPLIQQSELLISYLLFFLRELHRLIIYKKETMAHYYNTIARMNHAGGDIN